MPLNKNITESFKNAFEQDCFELIINAYKVALSERRFQLDWLENDFSELLNYYVNNSSLSIDKKITCKTENKQLKDLAQLDKGIADKLPRIDFIYSKIWKKQRFSYVIEAKNLKENDSKLKRRYIKTGIDSFVSGKYDNGSLIGYLLEGEIDDTIKGINSLLVKDKRSTETLEAKNNKICPSYYESYHTEIGVLKHVILNFTEISN